MEDWPETCSLPWNTFANRMQTPLYDAVPDMCQQGKHLLERMLTFDPSQRITASEALHEAYFRDEGFTAVTFSPSSCRSTPVPMSCSSNDDSGHSLTSDSLPDNWNADTSASASSVHQMLMTCGTMPAIGSIFDCTSGHWNRPAPLFLHFLFIYSFSNGQFYFLNQTIKLIFLILIFLNWSLHLLKWGEWLW